MADETPAEDGDLVARAIYDALATLVAGPERFLITNDSLRHLIELYHSDFLKAAGRRNRETLLASWTRDAALFRKEWLDTARQTTVPFGPAMVPVVTESATF